MFKRRCRWQEVPEVPAVYRALLKVSKVGGIIGGGRWRGGSWGQSQGCYLGNNCKIASSPLLVMVGFFSLCCFLFFAQPCEAHLAIQRLGPIRAQGNGLFLLYFVFVYLNPPPPPKKLFFSIFSSNSAPVLPPYPSRKCSAWLGPRTAEQKWSHHSFLVTDCLEQMRLFLLLSNQQTL